MSSGLNIKQLFTNFTLGIFAYFHFRNPAFASESIAVDGVLSTGITPDTGIIIIKIATKSAIFYLHNEAATPTTAKAAGHAVFNAAKDNASTINVYWEADQLKVQNKTAAAIVILSINGDAYAG